MRAAVVALAVLAAGCTTAHVAADSQFTPPLNGEFAFVSNAYAGLAESDPAAERKRLAVLDERMTGGRFCPRGYEITDRRAVKGEGLLESHTIYYRGRCK